MALETAFHRAAWLVEEIDELQRKDPGASVALICRTPDAARTFILSQFTPLLDAGGDQVHEAEFTDDWKSALQEWLQAANLGLPTYRLAATEGPDHRKRFDIEVVVNGVAAGRAVGKSKKEAEQQAARATLLALRGPGASSE